MSETPERQRERDDLGSERVRLEAALERVEAELPGADQQPDNTGLFSRG